MQWLMIRDQFDLHNISQFSYNTQISSDEKGCRAYMEMHVHFLKLL